MKGRHLLSDDASSTGEMEEAFSVFQTAGLNALQYYYLGTIPFIIMFLSFIGEMSNSAFARDRLPESALLVVFAYGWMKTWQALYGRRLLVTQGIERPRLTPAETLRMALYQFVVHSSGLFLLPLSALLTIPFGWVYAFYQSFSINADAAPLREQLRRAIHEAKLAPFVNHAALAVYLLMTLLLLVNLIATAIFLPTLLRQFTGIDLIASLNDNSFFNTTMITLYLGASYLLMDPIIKAFYALRSFQYQSRQSGKDLLIRIRKIRTHLSAATLFLAALFTFPPPAVANPPTTTPVVQQERTLDRSIDTVLARREFAWRFPRGSETDAPPSWLAQKLKSFVEYTTEKIKQFTDWVRSIIEKRRPDPQRPPGGSISALSKTLNILLYASIAILALGGAWLIWKRYRLRKNQPTELANAALTTPLPDLNREEIRADQLPSDGWESMALDLIAKGEFRLATRALYLAGLAHLSRQQWITLAKAKSNREFHREITRRAPMHPELTTHFGQSIREFEKVWYGRHSATEETAHHAHATLHLLRQF